MSSPTEANVEQGLVFDLSERAKWRITGADRLRYLNGQISNDLRKASETQAVHACVLSAKGKIDAEVFITVDGEAFLMESERGVAEALAARLERYIIADDVQIEEVTEEFALFHVSGAEVPAISIEVKRRAALRYGVAGTDLWVKRDGACAGGAGARAVPFFLRRRLRGDFADRAGIAALGL